MTREEAVEKCLVAIAKDNFYQREVTKTSDAEALIEGTITILQVLGLINLEKRNHERPHER